MSKFLAWCRNPNRRKRDWSSIHGQIYFWACLLRDDGVGHARAYYIIRRMLDAEREAGARFVPDREVLSAIQYSYEVTPSTGTVRTRPWPVPNRALQGECRRLSKARGWTLAALRESSALTEADAAQFGPWFYMADMIGKGALVCVGQGVAKFETVPLEDADPTAPVGVCRAKRYVGPRGQAEVGRRVVGAYFGQHGAAPEHRGGV
jgi:hypothetical protein